MTLRAKDERPIYGDESKLGLGTSLGVGLGAAFGIAIGQPIIGASVGVLVGVGLALIWDRFHH